MEQKTEQKSTQKEEKIIRERVLTESFDKQATPERVRAIFQTLTPLEQVITHILDYTKHAVTVNEIQTEIIEALFAKCEIMHARKKVTLPNGEEINDISTIPIFGTILRIMDFHINYAVADKVMAEYKSQDVELNKSLRTKEKRKALVKTKAVSIPNFKTIENALSTLEASGFVIIRPLGKKQSHYYALHPEFRLFLDKGA
jgi:hypothetical protein